MTGNDGGSSEQERIVLESVVQPKNNSNPIKNQEFDSLISFEPIETAPQTEIIRQPSPPPVLVYVQDLIPTSLPDTETMTECGQENSSGVSFIRSEDSLQLHISTQMMESFMKLAKSNTDKNLETCGILGGSLRNRKFYITALIIPKQESTTDSCLATNEDEIFEVQDKQSLFPLGWIHTHPTQSCFMSSIDIHTQYYSYQIMLPEAIAISIVYMSILHQMESYKTKRKFWCVQKPWHFPVSVRGNDCLPKTGVSFPRPPFRW